MEPQFLYEIMEINESLAATQTEEEASDIGHCIQGNKHKTGFPALLSSCRVLKGQPTSLSLCTDRLPTGRTKHLALGGSDPV